MNKRQNKENSTPGNNKSLEIVAMSMTQLGRLCCACCSSVIVIMAAANVLNQ